MWTFLPPLLLSLACTAPQLDSGDPAQPDSDSTSDTGDSATDTGDTGDAGGDTAPPVTDGDGDGYDAEPEGDDCDDADPAVNPGATETWYDGVDSDCSGGSDYDADGDGADAEDHGGTDCDDTDEAIQEDCPESDSLLDDYTLATSMDTVIEIGSNLSGITWNSVTETFMAVLDSNRMLVELDPDMAVLLEISLSNVLYWDTEDIVYIGQDADDTPTYAIVTEDGVVYLGTVPDDASTQVDLETWQLITYAADEMGNIG